MCEEVAGCAGLAEGVGQEGLRQLPAALAPCLEQVHFLEHKTDTSASHVCCGLLPQGFGKVEGSGGAYRGVEGFGTKVVHKGACVQTCCLFLAGWLSWLTQLTDRP